MRYKKLEFVGLGTLCKAASVYTQGRPSLFYVLGKKEGAVRRSKSEVGLQDCVVLECDPFSFLRKWLQ